MVFSGSLVLTMREILPVTYLLLADPLEFFSRVSRPLSALANHQRQLFASAVIPAATMPGYGSVYLVPVPIILRSVAAPVNFAKTGAG